MNQLPITQVLPQLQQALEASQIIIEAPPGAGKSTWLPLWLLQQQMTEGRIIMLEPRRLAARSIAQYLAAQLNEQPGQTVGYRMRGESRIGKQTRLEVVTEGVLTRMLQADPELNGVGLLIFDEFHERSLQADLALAFALECQALRNDLKIMVMSATLDGLALNSLLPEAALVSSQGRSFPVALEYRPRNLHTPLEESLGLAVLDALGREQGSLLAFLPGEREIRRSVEWLNERLPDDVELRPLYGRLSLVEQQAAIAPAQEGRRKLVLATNVAETSLTIEGITLVVDSGLERQARFDPESGITQLHSRLIGQASATQRAGRAGRLQPGTCIRLWSREQQERLAPRRPAEIEQSCLSGFLLECAAWGAQPEQLPLLTPPPASLLAAAQQQLEVLGLLAGTQLTPLGRRVWQLGCEPWLGQLLLTALAWQQQGHKGALADGVWLLALLEENRLGDSPLSGQILAGKGRIRASARRWFERIKQPMSEPEGTYVGVLLANARPEWLGQLRGGRRYGLAGGLSADLPEGSPLTGKSWLAVAALGRSERGVFVQAAEPVELSQLQSLLPERFSEREQLEWDADADRVRAERQRCFGRLVLQRTPLSSVSPEQKAQCLLQEIQKRGWAALPLNEKAEQTWLRMQLAGQKLADKGFMECDETAWLADAEQWLAPHLHGLGRWSELGKLDWHGILLSRLDWPQRQLLDTLLPSQLELATGTKAAIRYRKQEDPVLPVKLQEMFGQPGSPLLAEGRVPLLLELLSPARRPLQLTRDLAAFWAGAYDDVKKEMRGRYPKHPWPDDPANTAPTRYTKKRMNH
ncbi:ATP-dependent helicase HrpB [Oceanimonas smirnovii]|uniref:ATP-dependent helicase HrpB n=1 Tax=Oceanimonas smirnovii TaxID=264574 RepID=UPI003AAF1ED0